MRVVRIGCALALSACLFLPGGAVASASSIRPALVTISPPGPYVSGQLVAVNVLPNSILTSGRSLTVEECAAPTPFHRHHLRCDPHTKQSGYFTADGRGIAGDTSYPIVALPTRSAHREHDEDDRPVCDLTHACVLMVGWDLDDAGHRVSSAPFLVSPPGSDPNPGTGTPEVPAALALPVITAVILGGWVLVRRRRSSAT